MKGLHFLKKLYAGDHNQSCQLLADRLAIADMINDKCLNLAHSDFQIAIKTLMLAVRLIKLDPERIKPIFPCDFITISQDMIVQTSHDCLMARSLIDRLVLYLNWLLKNPVYIGMTKIQEMEVITSNMVRLTESSLLKEDRTIKYCDFVNWLAEEQLYQLWMGISKEMIHFQEYELQEFNSFYQKYTMFCTFRRKIPKVKHKDLRSIIVTPELNSRIQRKLNSFSKIEQNCNLQDQREGSSLSLCNLIACEFFE